MVNVPEARKFGFRMELHEDAMRAVLTGDDVKRVLAAQGESAREHVVAHVRATASADDAANYVASMFVDDTFSDALGMDFDGAYSLGSRPVVAVGIPSGRGADPSQKPPFMVEAQTHALSSVPGSKVGSTGEDIR